MTHYKNIFQPITLRHKTLDNRIVFGAHTANMSDQGLPGEDKLPGLDNGNVWSCEEVLRGQAMLGDAIILLDEGGSWRSTAPGPGSKSSAIAPVHDRHPMHSTRVVKSASTCKVINHE